MNFSFQTGVAFPPSEDVRKILIFRTAPTPLVVRTYEHLRTLYPSAEYSILGTALNHEHFQNMAKFEIAERWITTRSYKRVRQLVEQNRFDIAVLCLNSEHISGYGRASNVLRLIPASTKLVAGYTGNWWLWQHSDFVEGGVMLRGIVNSMVALLYPVVALYLAFKPARPLYLPEEQQRPAPGYER